MLGFTVKVNLMWYQNLWWSLSVLLCTVRYILQHLCLRAKPLKRKHQAVFFFVIFKRVWTCASWKWKYWYTEKISAVSDREMGHPHWQICNAPQPKVRTLYSFISHKYHPMINLIKRTSFIRWRLMIALTGIWAITIVGSIAIQTLSMEIKFSVKLFT